ncbi:hypothetical protein [Sphingomonas sanxanigenens]|uniref:Secreted protein n=1 Tax=Sphingomonas sanxanigenens DSM 19645 = NX02 TaxID=1123269 RepID=A0A0F7JSU6_9SPHN|nr:hypothetical protein [Sphingomonas sanxanigenens]AKH18742.1 hypothetical protein NX02_p0505 [Sphingomonas sanxanigenens DSM 19645 = NX02]
MAFAIFEPAILAVLLAGVGQPAPAAPASPCSRHATITSAFDCCLDLAPWKAPPTAPLNRPASSPDGAADQKEGR